jgi:hypothetical protein
VTPSHSSTESGSEPYVVATVTAAGEYRPEWTWVALRDGVVVAAWWAGPKDDNPLALDWFDFTDAGAAAQLLRTSPLHVQYSLELPPGWRDIPAVREQAQARIDAAVAAGLSPLVERFRYRWTPDCDVPARPGRLEFRPPAECWCTQRISRMSRCFISSRITSPGDTNVTPVRNNRRITCRRCMVGRCHIGSFDCPGPTDPACQGTRHGDI